MINYEFSRSIYVLKKYRPPKTLGDKIQNNRGTQIHVTWLTICFKKKYKKTHHVQNNDGLHDLFFIYVLKKYRSSKTLGTKHKQSVPVWWTHRLYILASLGYTPEKNPKQKLFNGDSIEMSPVCINSTSVWRKEGGSCCLSRKIQPWKLILRSDCFYRMTRLVRHLKVPRARSRGLSVHMWKLTVASSIWDFIFTLFDSAF